MQAGPAVVTGATGGLGFEVALGLARTGRHVLLTGRNPAKGAAALTRLRAAVPGAEAGFELLDLASLHSVHEFSDRMAVEHPAIGILVNNAGIMAPPRRVVTVDGFELQTATNYLGHFALTARLLPQMLHGAARVVNVSSMAHRRARLDFADLQGERHYGAWALYGQSKLAMLMFALELNRRAVAAGWTLRAMAAHPGWAVTDIIVNGPGAGVAGPREYVMQAGFRLFGQSAAAGAAPILYAAADPGAQGGGYYGPNGFGELRGTPAPSRIMPQVADHAAAVRLWTVSEALTGVTFPTG